MGQDMSAKARLRTCGGVQRQAVSQHRVGRPSLDAHAHTRTTEGAMQGHLFAPRDTRPHKVMVPMQAAQGAPGRAYG